MNLNPEHFQVTERDGLRLIVPARAGAVGNAPWTPRTIQYRSRVETLEGKLVSTGFFKFFNLGMGPEGLNVSIADVARAIGNRDAVATLKIDGSLLVRSVHDGKLMLRTRGSFGYEFLDNADEIEIFRAQAPKLFDPTKFPNMSLLFEWVSPKNVIVLKYPEPKISLIGAIHHGGMNYLKMSMLEEIAKIVGLECVKWFDLTTKGWEELQEAIKADATIEGYVLRLFREQVLVKVKCEPYLTKHSLKSKLDSETLADMWFHQGQPTFEKFSEQFVSDFDEETYLWALGAISSLFDGVKELKGILRHMREKAKQRSGLSRKDAALLGLSEYGQTKKFAAYIKLWEGKEPETNILKSILLQHTKQIELGMFKETSNET